MWGWTMGKAKLWRRFGRFRWEQIHPVMLAMDPPQGTGRKRADPRRMLEHHLPDAQWLASGTVCPGNWETTVTGPSSAGWSWDGGHLGCSRAPEWT